MKHNRHVVTAGNRSTDPGNEGQHLRANIYAVQICQLASRSLQQVQGWGEMVGQGKEGG